MFKSSMLLLVGIIFNLVALYEGWNASYSLGITILFTGYMIADSINQHNNRHNE